ncbi:hypothetical protein F5Y14DRAFT_402129 [Nemania sp. NC0429]|nr:hypothetical protein F5Y14DRAFT_402129 [Nemania sp. NC0429]
MRKHQQPHPGQGSIPSERHPLGKPQLFVQLSFGVSWSDRHVPRTHTLSYTSKQLKNARNSGHFPRQDPELSHQHRRRDSLHRQNRSERQHQERPRGRAGHCSHYPGALSPSRQSRSDSRRGRRERGSSALPAAHDSAWVDEEGGGPSATLFPRPARTTRNLPHVWKDLPSNPGRFRLGEDGLPWSAWAWPLNSEGDDEEPPFANLPTTLPLSPPSRPRSEDPQRARELESLSTAMVTVDNGFENQWWNQGTREPTAELSPIAPEEDVHPMSPADALLLSAAEPPSGVETYSSNDESFRGLVSPLSDFSPGFSISNSMLRSRSAGSDELWLDS